MGGKVCCKQGYYYREDNFLDKTDGQQEVGHFRV